MLDSFRIRPHIRARLATNPLGAHLDAFVEMLLRAGYSARIVRCHIRAADDFGRWLTRRSITATGVSERTLARFVAGFARYPSRTHRRGKLPSVANGAHKVAEFLWAEGIAIRDPGASPNTSHELVLNAFAEHLDREGQFAPGTRRNYLRNARDLLSAYFGFAEPDWGQLTAETVADFVRTKAARLSPSACRPPVTYTRAFLRFLVMRGSIRPGFEAAVPTLREWKHASLPRHVTTETVERVIRCCDCGAPAGKRDRAVLLLLSRLGLRASEVAHLHLADIHWAEGSLLVRAGKTRRERSLPVPGDVGEAIAAYLQDGRPATSAQTVFVRATAPCRSLGPSSVSGIAQRAFGRAGVASGSAHTLRHTVATQMVRHGVSFKEIADLLGHASIATTAIYAKLDTEKLSAVALPWPGGPR